MGSESLGREKAEGAGGGRQRRPGASMEDSGLDVAALSVELNPSGQTSVTPARQTNDLSATIVQEDAKFVTSRSEPGRNQATSVISGGQIIADRKKNHGGTQVTSPNSGGQPVTGRGDTPDEVGRLSWISGGQTVAGQGEVSPGGIMGETMHIVDESTPVFTIDSGPSHYVIADGQAPPNPDHSAKWK